jgi:hypothetical protein
MKTKDQMINVVKKWYSDIADLRAMHRLVLVVHDNAGEYKSQRIKELFESKGIRNHFVLLVSNGGMNLPNKPSIR